MLKYRFLISRVRPEGARYENYAGKTEGHESRIQLAGCDRRRGHGPARLAQERHRQGKRRRQGRGDRRRCSRSSRPRSPASSRRTPARFCSIPNLASPPPPLARRTPACCSPMKTAATTIRSPAACPICSTSGPSAALCAAGADCIKILLYYTPFDPPDINEIKHAWIERIGGECTAADVPFFLELVGYEEGARRKGHRLRAQEARNRRARHGGIFQASIRRRRSQGRSSCEYGLRRRRQSLQG